MRLHIFCASREMQSTFQASPRLSIYTDLRSADSLLSWQIVALNMGHAHGEGVKVARASHIYMCVIN